jgi:hypothetical protein
VLDSRIHSPAASHVLPHSASVSNSSLVLTSPGGVVPAWGGSQDNNTVVKIPQESIRDSVYRTAVDVVLTVAARGTTVVGSSTPRRFVCGLAEDLAIAETRAADMLRVRLSLSLSLSPWRRTWPSPRRARRTCCGYASLTLSLSLSLCGYAARPTHTAQDTMRR